MKLKKSKIYSLIMAIVLLVIAIIQTMNGLWVAIFPFGCSLFFIYRTWTMTKDK